jgi:stage II sporulation protein D
MYRAFTAAIALVVALSCAATARPATTFVLKGKGWGHGLGLAQYGAYGFARDGGRDYRWILDHYYTGTTLGSAGVGRVRVLVAEGAGSVTVGSTAAFTVTSGNGQTYNVSAGTYTINASLRIRTANGQTRALAGPIRFNPGAAPLRLSGNGYRGMLRVRAQGGRVSVVNDVGLEPYIKGVVAWEMPASWHAEALKAQAVVARTFGLVSRKTGQWFDLYDDTRSQVYGGMRAEDSRASAAVNATRGEVVRSGGALAWTVYHSTSGGKTASRADEWGPPGISYLVGVPDPHDGISPHHVWGPTDAEDDCSNSGRDCVWTAAALKRDLGGLAPTSIVDFVVSQRNGSSRVARARLVGPSGARTVTGGTLRTELGLRSTWFTVGVLRLTGGGTVQQGQAKTLRVLTRNLTNVKLQRKVGAGSWVDVRSVRGSVNVTVRPGATTLYRLKSPAATGQAVRVTVSSSSSGVASAVTASGTATGTAAPGDVVQVQRRVDGGSWVTVAVAFAHADGSWRASVSLSPGEYRAYTASASGAGTRPTLSLAAE